MWPSLICCATQDNKTEVEHLQPKAALTANLDEGTVKIEHEDDQEEEAATTKAEEEETLKAQRNAEEAKIVEEETARKKLEDDEAARKKAEEEKEEAARKAEVNKPPGTCEFTIKLIKDPPDAPLGLSLCKSEDQLVVLKPDGNALEKWNKNNPDKKVISGDQIISVSGTSGSSLELMDALGKNKELDIVLKRRFQVAVDIKKGIGFGILLDENNFITEVRKGPLQEFNLKSDPIELVFPGDQLCRVNDLTDNLLEEMQRIQEGVNTQLVFKRPIVE